MILCEITKKHTARLHFYEPQKKTFVVHKKLNALKVNKAKYFVDMIKQACEIFSSRSIK